MDEIKKIIEEEPILFASMLKWTILATCIGVIVGLSTGLFLKALAFLVATTSRCALYYLALPFAFLFSTFLIQRFAPDAEGHGTEKVIEAIHRYSGKIKASVVPVKILATLATIAAGGSVGKEGPCAQIGGGLASLFADLLKFSASDRRKLVICGISAGFASVFGTPIGGAILGVEVLFVGTIEYTVLLPSFIAGITSYQVTSAMGIQYFHHTLQLSPAIDERMLLQSVAAGCFFGLCSIFFITMLNLGRKLSERIKIGKIVKSLLGGGILVLLASLFTTRYLGLGLDTIESTLAGQPAAPHDFFLKSLFTSLSLNFGGSGGVVTPIFFVGATSGSLFAGLFHLSRAEFACIGLVSLLAGTANTPIAASIMAIELFGPAIAPYAAVSCIISFLITGHRSVYPSQVLFRKKSPSIEAMVGQTIDSCEPLEQPVNRTWKQAVQKTWCALLSRLQGSRKDLKEGETEETGAHKEK
jgi:H+/Cl- antiporter ClcA